MLFNNFKDDKIYPFSICNYGEIILNKKKKKFCRSAESYKLEL